MSEKEIRIIQETVDNLNRVEAQRDALLEALKKLSAACQASGFPEELERDFRAALIHAEFAIAKAGKEAPSKSAERRVKLQKEDNE